MAAVEAGRLGTVAVRVLSPLRAPHARIGLALLATVGGVVVARAASGHPPAMTRAVALPGGVRAQVADVQLQDPALGSVTRARPGTALVTVRVRFTNYGGTTEEVGPYSQLDLSLGPSGPPVAQDPGFVGATDRLTSLPTPLPPERTALLWRSFAVPRTALGRLALRVSPDLRTVDPVVVSARLPVPRH